MQEQIRDIIDHAQSLALLLERKKSDDQTETVHEQLTLVRDTLKNLLRSEGGVTKHSRNPEEPHLQPILLREFLLATNKEDLRHLSEQAVMQTFQCLLRFPPPDQATPQLLLSLYRSMLEGDGFSHIDDMITYSGLSKSGTVNHLKSLKRKLDSLANIGFPLRIQNSRFETAEFRMLFLI